MSNAVPDRVTLSTAVLISSDLAPHNARIHALVLAGLEAEQRRAKALETLQAANAEHSKAVRLAVHQAADKLLTPAKRRITSRREWCGLLWQWLWLPERQKLFGLEQRPCMRSIRAALKDWEPQQIETAQPNGDALPQAFNGASLDSKG